MSKATFGVSVGVVLCAVGFVVWRSIQLPKVEVVPAVRQDVTSTLAVSGVLESANRSAVASQISGAKVTRVYVDIGDRVRKGQILADLDSADAMAQIQSAEAQVFQAQAQIGVQDVNKQNAERSLHVATEGLSSVNDLRLAVSQAETSYRTAKQRVTQLAANLDRTRNASRVEQVRQAEAHYAQAVSIRDLRKKELNRNKILVHEGALAESVADVSQSALDTAQLDVDVALEAIRLAKTPRVEDVQQATAQLKEANLVVDGAWRSLVFARKVLADRYVERQQVIQAQTQRDSAVSGRKVAEAQSQSGLALKQAAMAALDKTHIRAPLDGRISERLVEPGQTVTAGASMFTLSGETQLRVKLDVDESSISFLKVGQQATISMDAFPTLQIPGEITDIGSSANFQKGTVEVRLRLLSNDSRLKPELTADVNIIVGSYKQAVVVPHRSILNPNDHPQLYTVKNGVVTAKDVKWVMGNQDNSVILNGVDAGEEIVLVPRLTQPGAHVSTIKAKSLGGQ